VIKAASVYFCLSQTGEDSPGCQQGGSRYARVWVHTSHPGHTTASPNRTAPGGGRNQTYFSKRKAQRMARKEAQSTTIQIMRYVLLGCKATRQAMNTGQGWCAGGTAQPAVPAVTESQNHRMVGVGRDLCWSSSPTLLPKQGHLQQAAQDLPQGHTFPCQHSTEQKPPCRQLAQGCGAG